MKQRVKFRHRLLATCASVAIMLSSLSTGVFADGEVPQSQVGSHIAYEPANQGFTIYGIDDDGTIIRTTYAGSYDSSSAYFREKGKGYRVLFSCGSQEITTLNGNGSSDSTFQFGQPQEIAGLGYYVLTAEIEPSGKAVLLTYTITNTSASSQNFRIATISDCMIGGDDNAPISDYQGTGLVMTERGTSNRFYLLRGNVPFTTRWFGTPNTSLSNAYNNFSSSSSTGDSALAWSWTVSLGAGETQERTCRVAVGSSNNINFNATNGSGTMESTSLLTGIEGPLPPCTFTPPANSTFAGWATSDDEGAPIVYTDEEIITIDSDITLYAVWKGPFDPPTARDITYNGQPQELVTAGSLEDGVVWYRLGENGEFHTEIPTTTAAGDYIVYYYVVGGEDPTAPREGNPEYVEAHISPLCTAPSEQLIYNGQPQVLVNTDNSVSIPDGQKLFYKVDDGEYSENPPTATSVGDHVVSYYIGTEGNPPATPEQVTVNIAHLITPKAGIKYTGSPVVLIEDVPAEAGTIHYQVDGGEWTTDMPTAISSGDHTIRYYVGDDLSTAQEITSTIATSQIEVSFNDGIGGEYSNQEVNPEHPEQDLALPVPANRPGYTFAGWYTDNTFEHEIAADNLSNLGATNITLVAGWNANLILHANNGTDTTETDSRLTGVDLPLPTNPFTRSHHLFLGWAESATATVPTYSANNPDLTINIDGNKDLYAVWQEQYSAPTAISGLTYNGQAQDLVTRDATLDTSDTPVTVYYSLEENGTYTTDIPQATSSGTHRVYYYVDGDIANKQYVDAYIAPTTINVTFDDGIADTTNPSVSVDPEHPTNLTMPENPTRDGYTFAGWYTDSNFTTPLGTNNNNLGASDTTLYAGWEAVLTMDPNGGTGSVSTSSLLTGVSQTIPNVEYTRSHHEFLGWSTDADAESPDYHTGDSIDFTGPITLYAVWQEQYSTPAGITGLQYNGQAQALVTRTDDDIPVYYSLNPNSGFNTAIPTGTASGTYTVYYYVDGDEENVQEIEVTIAKKYIDVTFDDGIAGNEDPVIQVDAENPNDISSQIPTPATRTGYTFEDWFVDENYENPFDPEDLGLQNTTIRAGWKTNLNFSANGGIGSMETVSIFVGVPYELPANTFTRSHYMFGGWAVSSGSNIAVHSDRATITIDQETTLYAVWSPKFTAPTANTGLSYTGEAQELVSRDASADLDSNVTVYYSLDPNVTFTPSIPTATSSGNYTVYYYVDGDANNVQSIPVSIARTYIDVTFDDGITGNEDSVITVDAENPNAISSQIPTPDAREGYTFEGWFVDANFTNEFDPSNLGTQDATIRAGWKVNLTFNANGGNGTMETRSLFTGLTHTLPNNAFTRSHHEFLGWATEAGSTTVVYEDGDAIVLTAPTTLYAVWESQYTAPTANTGLSYTGQPQELVSRNTSSDNATVYYSLSENGVFSDEIPTATASGTYTVYYYVDGDANNKQQITVTIDKTYIDVTFDDGIDGNEDTVVENIDAENPNTISSQVPTPPTREGYTFAGWFVDDNFTDTFEPGDLGTQDATIRAGWKVSLTFDANGGTGTLTTPPLFTVVQNTLPANTFTRAHHLFLGWSTSPTATTAEYQDEGSIVLTEATTLYAVWQRQYTTPTAISGLSYTGQPQELVTRDTSSDNATVYYSLSEDGEFSDVIPTATASGTYTVYYYVDGDENNKQQLTVTIDKTFIDVTFDDGVDGTDDSVVHIDAELAGTITPPADPTRDGYVFAGWYTDENFTDLCDYDDLAAQDTTLYAGWKANLTFDANGGLGTMDSRLVLVDVANTLPDNEFTRSHHTFLGWATSPDATEAEFEDGADIVITEATTLYAVWQSNYAAPTAVSGLAYNGQAQSLVSRDESQDAQGENVTIYYALSENGPFSTTMPTATESGSYTVYYYVDGDESNIEQFTVTIDAVTVPVTIDGTTTNMNAEDTLTRPADPTRPGYEFTGWYTDEACTQPYDFNSPVGANGVTLYAGWNDVREDATCTTAPSGLDGVSYNGQGQALVAPGSTEDGTIYYSLSENGPFSTTIPVASASGTYTVYYYVAGDELHHDSALQHFTVTIAPQYVPVTFDGTTTTANAELPLTRPADPSRDGYTFTGWYADEACTQPYDFSSPVGVLGVRLYSGWRLNPAYSITEGAGSEFTINGTNGLRFRAVRNTDEASTFSHFTGVSVDGQLIDPSNYTAVSGSVIVTLNASYLNTLAAGTHTLSIHFNDGDSVTTTFTVVAASGVANTGEDPHSVTSALGVILLLAGVAVTYYTAKARKEEI